MHSVVFLISKEESNGLYPGLPVLNSEIPFHMMSFCGWKEMWGTMSRAATAMFGIFKTVFPRWTLCSGIDVAGLLRNHLPPCSVHPFHVAPFQCPVG